MSKKKQRPATVEDLAKRRPTGLAGTFSGTCIGCLRATDAGLAVKGEPEWHAAFLVAIGLPESEAIASAESGADDPEYGPGVRVYQVCAKCASKVPSFPAPVLVIPGEACPVIAQPGF